MSSGGLGNGGHNFALSSHMQHCLGMASPNYPEQAYSFTTPDGAVHDISIGCYTELPPDEALALLSGDDRTGQLVWKGALLMANFLAARPELVHSKHVLELGSGCGLVGILCSLLGAKSVTLTDGAEVWCF